MIGESQLKPDEILSYCLKNFKGTVLTESWGERGIFYNPDYTLKRGIYVLTVKEKDGKNDKASDLNRENTFRVNLGIRKKTFVELFSFIPKRPQAGGVVEMEYNFKEYNEIIPHPVYAWMGWISILNPSKEAFEKLKPLIQEAYDLSLEKFNKK